MTDRLAVPAAGSPPRLAWLLLIALLAAAVVTGVVVGARLLEKSSPPLPVGGSAVFAYGSFVGNEIGQTGGDIFIARADGTDIRQLTDGPGIKSKPTFSPDGTRIAYLVQQSATGIGPESVVVMDAGGGNPAGSRRPSSRRTTARIARAWPGRLMGRGCSSHRGPASHPRPGSTVSTRSTSSRPMAPRRRRGCLRPG